MGQPITGAMGNAAPAAVNEEDDWEYEYDPNDTEDLYFTLDLTTHVPDALVTKAAPAHGSHEVNGSAGRPSSREENDGEDDGEEESVTEDDVPVGNVQIIDLHTTNPLVKFGDEIFSCYWSTDLGTQVHIAQAGEITKPRRAGTVLDIVGTSQTRLIGKPISLKPRDDVETAEPQEEDRQTTNLIDIRGDSESQTDDPSQYSTPQPGQGIEIPRDMCTNRDEREQATFLERLSAAKLKKGEQDAVPILGIRTYDPPRNMDEIRQRDIAAEAARVQRAKDDALASKGQPPKKRRRNFREPGTQRFGGTLSREQVATSLGLNDRPPSGLSNENGVSGESRTATERTSTPAGEDKDDDREDDPE